LREGRSDRLSPTLIGATRTRNGISIRTDRLNAFWGVGVIVIAWRRWEAVDIGVS